MFKRTVLSSGVRIVTEELPFLNSVSFGIWVKAGSRNETNKENGISHFIEHLQFKGTPSRSAREICEALEEVGGQINAFTTKEYTCYYAKVLSEHLPLAVEILTDMFFNSNYTDQDIEKEKGVIIEEIRSVEDTPDDIIHDFFAASLWHDHPLGKPILGTIETVKNLDRKAVLEYVRQQYLNENLVVTAAGKVSHQQVLELTESVFDIKHNSISPRETSPPNPKPTTCVSHRANEQVQLCIGTPAYGHDDPKLYPLIVLNNVLGGGLSSRLFQEIREERGLVYSIFSYNAAYFDCGLWCINAGTNVEHLEEVLHLSLNILGEVKRRGISTAELNRSKQQVRGELLLSMESTTSHMSRLGRTEISYGKAISVEVMVEKVMEVNAAEVLDTAGEMLTPDNFSLAIIGPYRREFDLAGACVRAGLD